MDVRIVSDNYHFFYDPLRYGYDEDWFVTISGDVKCIGGKIRINSGKFTTLGSYMFGRYPMAFTIPTAPSSGDSRVFGLYSKTLGNRNAAYFYISGTSFYARTYGPDSAVAESTTIPWDSDWTNTPTVFEIKWRIDGVEFWINGRQVANHYDRFPVQTMVPMYFSNGADDGMFLNYL